MRLRTDSDDQIQAFLRLFEETWNAINPTPVGMELEHVLIEETETEPGTLQITDVKQLAHYNICLGALYSIPAPSAEAQSERPDAHIHFL